MALDKKDLNQIEKIVGKVGTNLREEITTTKTELKKDIKDTENRVIAVFSREITDLSEINRAVIQRVDKITELEKRIIRIEHKIGIVG